MVRKLGDRAIATSTAVIIAVIITAIIVGPAVYMLKPAPPAPPAVVTKEGVIDYLKEAPEEDVKDIIKEIPTDLIAEVVKIRPRVIMGFVNGGYISGSTWDGRYTVAAERLKALFDWFDYVYDEGVVLEGRDPAASARDLIGQGAELIVGSWEPCAVPAFHTVAEEYPDLYFLGNIGTDISSRRNFSRFFPRQYQAMYLEGLIAAALTKTNKIGIAVGPACVQNYRRMAAFYLGIQDANKVLGKDAKLYIKYVGEWYAPTVEMDVSLALIDLGCDVLTNYTDSTAPVDACADRGIWYVGKDTDVASIGDAALKMDVIGDKPWATTDVVAVSFDTRWEVIWYYYLKEYLAGNRHPDNLIFLGMDDYIPVPADSPFLPEGNMLLTVDLQNGGKIGVDAISPKARDLIPEEIIKLVEERRAQMIAGTWDPFFEHELVSSGIGVEVPEIGLTVPPKGTVVKPAKTPASDEFLLGKLNFQLEGIILIE